MLQVLRHLKGSSSDDGDVPVAQAQGSGVGRSIACVRARARGRTQKQEETHFDACHSVSRVRFAFVCDIHPRCSYTLLVGMLLFRCMPASRARVRVT